MPNRRRKNQVKFYMDDDELLELDEKVSSTQMSRGEYLRAIAHGLQPVAKPDMR